MQALAHFDLAARLSPTPQVALREIIRAAGGSGAVEQGLAACERLLSLEPRGADAPQVHLQASDWCEALGQASQAARHLEVAVLQGAGGATALHKLARHYDETKTWPEAAATLTWFAEVAGDEGARAEAWRRASHIYADEVGDPAQAASVARRALAIEPGAVDLLEWLCELEVRRGQPAGIVAACEELQRAAGPGSLAGLRKAYGTALGEVGRAAEALALLQQELAERFDEALALRARDLAQGAGNLEAWLALELQLVDRLGADGKDEAAARLRQAAGRVEEQNPARAADLIGRAAALAFVPADSEREASLRERAGDLAGAARPLALVAAARPLDEAVLGRFAAALRASGDLARASALDSIRSFADPSKRFPAAHTGARVHDTLRARLYVPEALGPVSRLLRVLAPALGAAFPSDLGRYGVGEADQVGPMHAPALAARVREARESVGLPSVDVFLAPSLGNEVALEPGAPDRIVVGLPCLTELDPGALSFLLTRACELLPLGPCPRRAGRARRPRGPGALRPGRLGGQPDGPRALRRHGRGDGRGGAVARSGGPGRAGLGGDGRAAEPGSCGVARGPGALGGPGGPARLRRAGRGAARAGRRDAGRQRGPGRGGVARTARRGPGPHEPARGLRRAARCVPRRRRVVSRRGWLAAVLSGVGVGIAGLSACPGEEPVPGESLGSFQFEVALKQDGCNFDQPETGNPYSLSARVGNPPPFSATLSRTPARAPCT
ncbi:MAG: hypothetical protein QM765_49585 [Myxococcales bacterium]